MTTTSRFAILSVAALFIAAAASKFPFIAFGSVQPNLVLAVLIAIALFTRNAAFFAVLVALSTLLVRSSPMLFDPIAIGTACSAFIIFIIKQRVVWPDRIGASILGAIGTIIVYLVAAPRFIITHPGMFFLELVLTSVLSLCLFELFAFVVGRRHE